METIKIKYHNSNIDKIEKIDQRAVISEILCGRIGLPGVFQCPDQARAFFRVSGAQLKNVLPLGGIGAEKLIQIQLIAAQVM